MDKPTDEQIKWAHERTKAYLDGSWPWSAEVEDRALNILLTAASSDPGPPRPSDMAELARMVTKELRKRGFFADHRHGHVVTLPRFAGLGGATQLRYLPICLGLSQFDTLTPKEIADVIQVEEAKKAAEWAGDE